MDDAFHFLNLLTLVLTFVCNKLYYHSILDLDPCTNTSCKYYSHCVASSPHQFTCVCENSCPSYEEQVCASNGRTFTNLCLLRKEICRTSGNYTNYHPGSCTGIINTCSVLVNIFKGLTDIETRKNERHSQRWTDRQSDGQRGVLTDWLIDWLRDSHNEVTMKLRGPCVRSCETWGLRLTKQSICFWGLPKMDFSALSFAQKTE